LGAAGKQDGGRGKGHAAGDFHGVFPFGLWASICMIEANPQRFFVR
jgi:hypothetical protein